MEQEEQDPAPALLQQRRSFVASVADIPWIPTPIEALEIVQVIGRDFNNTTIRGLHSVSKLSFFIHTAQAHSSARRLLGVTSSGATLLLPSARPKGVEPMASTVLTS